MARQPTDEIMEFVCSRCGNRVKWKYLCEKCTGINPNPSGRDDRFIMLCLKCCSCEKIG